MQPWTDEGDAPFYEGVARRRKAQRPPAPENVVMAKLTESHIVVVVNGVETVVNAHPETPLRTVAELALKQTKNGGRPLSARGRTDRKGTPLALSPRGGRLAFPS